MKAFFIAIVILLLPNLVFAQSVNKTVYTLRIVSNWFGPGDGILLASAWQAREQRPIDLPFPYAYDGRGPWDDGLAISIIGCHLIHQIATYDWGVPAKALSQLEIGSGHGGDGADVFATTGGDGSTQKLTMFQEHIILPQGVTGIPNYAHFDLYGKVYTSGLRQRALAQIFYILP